jgi:ABC-type sugar transport system permease subunit
MTLSLQGKNAAAGYLFILPFLLGFLAFMVAPIFQSLAMAFSAVKIDLPNRRFTLSFAGLENLNRLFFVDPEFNRLLTEELGKMLLIVPSVIIFSMFVALMLNRNFPGRGITRTIFFLPVVLSSGVIIGIEAKNDLFKQLQALNQGELGAVNSVTEALETILMSTGAMNNFMSYILNVVNQIYTVAMASGVQIVIFLSALQTIPPSMFEAAEMEGATSWECFWKITFPIVTPLILVNVVYSVIDYFIRTDNRVMDKIKTTTALLNYGYSSAMAWVYFLTVMLILALVWVFIARKAHYDV